MPKRIDFDEYEGNRPPLGYVWVQGTTKFERRPFEWTWTKMLFRLYRASMRSDFLFRLWPRRVHHWWIPPRKKIPKCGLSSRTNG